MDTHGQILPLVLEGVSFQIGSMRLIKDVDCTFDLGPRTVIIGPNGAGSFLFPLIETLLTFWRKKTHFQSEHARASNIFNLGPHVLRAPRSLFTPEIQETQPAPDKRQILNKPSRRTQGSHRSQGDLAMTMLA